MRRLNIDVAILSTYESVNKANNVMHAQNRFVGSEMQKRCLWLIHILHRVLRIKRNNLQALIFREFHTSANTL